MQKAELPCTGTSYQPCLIIEGTVPSFLRFLCFFAALNLLILTTLAFNSTQYVLFRCRWYTNFLTVRFSSGEDNLSESTNNSLPFEVTSTLRFECRKLERFPISPCSSPKSTFNLFLRLKSTVLNFSKSNGHANF